MFISGATQDANAILIVVTNNITLLDLVEDQIELRAEYGTPQALTWNSGTTGNTQSRFERFITSGATPA